MSPYVTLAVAILAEVTGTSAMKAANGFSRPVPSAVVVLAYCTSSYLLSLTVRSLPVGIVYAVWSGIGIVVVSAIGWVWYGQELDLPALAGLSLIVAGVLVINLLSRTVAN